MTIVEALGPLPDPDETAAPFWDALRRHELAMQRCDDCGRWRHPPEATCPACLGEHASWHPLSGEGTVYSLVRMERAFVPAARDRVPYTAVVVLPNEVPMQDVTVHNNEPYNVLFGLLVGDDEAAIGTPVVATYLDVTGDVTLLGWRRVDGRP
jgi:hypothetical protein